MQFCANHYDENLKKLPLTDDVLSTRENLVRWAIDMHNIVNISKNKPVMKYEDALNAIGTDEKCKENIVIKNNNIYYLLLIIFALICIAVVYKKK